MQYILNLIWFILNIFLNILIIHGRDIFVESCIRRFLVKRKGSLIFILWWSWISNHWKLIIIPGLIISIDIVQRNYLDEWHDVLCSFCSFLLLGVYMHLHKQRSILFSYALHSNWNKVTRLKTVYPFYMLSDFTATFGVSCMSKCLIKIDELFKL